MTYKEKLNPWCIIRPIPNLQAQVIARFRRRVDAEGRLKILNRMTPNSSFEIVFDTTPKDTGSPDGSVTT
jgi:Txe/YoeB family toxin of Txe-Axe toxin-antitoxin module